MTWRILAGSAAATVAFLVASTMAAAQTTQPSTSTTATQPCPTQSTTTPSETNATTTNGSPSSTSGVVEGEVPTTNPTKRTNTSQNGSPVENNVSNPTNLNEQTCTQSAPATTNTTPSTTTTQPATEHVPYRPGMSNVQNTTSQQPVRDMLHDNPNGSNWLDKFSRSATPPQ